MKNVFRITLVVVWITLVVCIGTAVGDGRDEKVYHGQLALALLPVSAVTLMLAGAIAEGAGKEIEALPSASAPSKRRSKNSNTRSTTGIEPARGLNHRFE